MKSNTQTPQNPVSVVDHGARPDSTEIQTEALQRSIDACAQAGGGRVIFPPGRYVSGTLHLRDHVHLHLQSGAVLAGSDDYRDYGPPSRRSALILGHGLRDTGISGPGIIDGSDCFQPGGEEGFRGPHGILFTDCQNIVVSDLTIRNAGNYALFVINSSKIHISLTRIIAGHDGFHLQACRDVTVQDCDLRTGDDCLAGCDNERITVERTYLNSSCNAFRLGCVDLVVRDCHFKGPGEYPHRVSLRHGGKPRTNMGAAFVHFAPDDRNPQLPSDRWLIENCTMENMNSIYSYNFERGIWQTGQPAKNLHFRKIQATKIQRPFRVLGDFRRQFQLTIEDSSISLHPEHQGQPFLELNQFDSLTIEGVHFNGGGAHPAIVTRNGNQSKLRDVTTVPPNDHPVSEENMGTSISPVALPQP